MTGKSMEYKIDKKQETNFDKYFLLDTQKLDKALKINGELQKTNQDNNCDNDFPLHSQS